MDAGGKDRKFTIRDATAPQRKRDMTYRQLHVERMVGHSRAANYVLGLSELQMNKVHDYGKVSDNQLRTLEQLGVFRVNWVDEAKGKMLRRCCCEGPDREGD